MAEITFSSDLLGIAVVGVVRSSFLRIGSVLWQFVQTSSRCTKYLISLEILTVVDLVVLVVHLLLKLSVVLILANLRVVVHASAHVAVHLVAHSSLHQFRGVPRIVILS